MKWMKSEWRLKKVMAIGHLFTTLHHSAKNKNDNTKQAKFNWK